jgi:hypothetical protein
MPRKSGRLDGVAGSMGWPARWGSRLDGVAGSMVLYVSYNLGTFYIDSLVKFSLFLGSFYFYTICYHGFARG